MGKKINIIQFLPYFPPHKGGLETVAEELSYFYVQEGYGEAINIISSIGQDIKDKIPAIYYNNSIIGYRQRRYTVYIIPSFDLISNFPVPKFWKREFWEILRRIKHTILDSQEEYIIQTHTRFFLSTLLGGIFSRYYGKKWVHIEHGSDYIRLGNKIKSNLSYLYDRLIGKWIFKNADIIIAISEACKKFIINNFVDRDINIIYRGLEIDTKSTILTEDLKVQFPGKIIIGFVGRILKWKNVDTLINAYYQLNTDLANRIQIVVIGDGEELQNLKKLDTKNKIHFTGSQEFDTAIVLQKQFDIHFHTSSPGGGLATTLLQAMYLGCLIVATPYEGADEVIIDGENGILLEDDTIDTFIRGIEDGVASLEKREKWSKVNEAIIKNKFAWEKNISQFYKIITQS